MKLTPKFSEKLTAVAAHLILTAVVIVALPFLLVYLLFKLVTTPCDYVKFKRSRYQRDFPRRFSLFATPHEDNAPYTVIRENDFPIEYVKWCEDYDATGYFLYRDVLLIFNEPFFFDEKKSEWLIWLGNDDEEGDGEDFDNTDDCLTVEEAKSVLLDLFHQNVPSREARRVKLFYCEKRILDTCGKAGLEKMREYDGFTVYRRGELAAAIGEFLAGEDAQNN